LLIIKYSIGVSQMNWWGAQKWCRSRGLILGSIDSFGKYKEVTNYLSSISKYYLLKFHGGKSINISKEERIGKRINFCLLNVNE
jgi:hypothetical protein